MKLYSLIISMFFVSIVVGQKTFIDTGRPKPVLERNAQDIVGKDFKVSYEYVAYNNTDKQLDSINKINAATKARMDKKCKDDWEGDLKTAIFRETSNLEAMTNVLIELKMISPDDFVYYVRKGKKGKYVAYVYGNIEPENRKNVYPQKILKIKKDVNKYDVKEK